MFNAAWEKLEEALKKFDSIIPGLFSECCEARGEKDSEELVDINDLISEISKVFTSVKK